MLSFTHLRLTAPTLGLIAALVLFQPIASAGTLYRWSDAKGNPVISDRPPPIGTPYTTLDSRKYSGGTSTRAPTPAPRPTPPSLPKAESESSSQAQRQPEIEKQPEICQRAEEQIFKLETFARVRMPDENGELRFMTDEERAQQLAVAREAAAIHCE